MHAYYHQTLVFIHANMYPSSSGALGPATACIATPNNPYYLKTWTLCTQILEKNIFFLLVILVLYCLASIVSSTNYIKDRSEGETES